MTVKELKDIIDPLPPYSIILIDGGPDLEDVETVNIEYKNNGSIKIILTNKE